MNRISHRREGLQYKHILNLPGGFEPRPYDPAQTKQLPHVAKVDLLWQLGCNLGQSLSNH
ncbi:hypothetical protein TNCV_3086511 [Trichonephila clavipes]|nr:hypothetical protein TNCV_3086511 [Trichonephila clavipes]